MYLKPTHKTCRDCGETKEVSQFYKKGLRCKPCTNIKTAEWQANNPDKVKVYKRKWFDSKGREYFKQLYSKNRERCLAATKKHNKIAKDRCYATYGGYLCVCCGETEEKFLTLDHINNDGAAHRRQLGPDTKERKSRQMGSTLYRWIIRNNFPPMFQVLCYNCNCGRNLNNGICPHKTRISEVA